MSYIVPTPESGVGTFLPLAGGTMTGAISLANVAATLTGGGSTATWTPTALTYTFTSARASGTDDGFSVEYSNAITSGSLQRWRDNTGTSARTLVDVSVTGAQLGIIRFYDTNVEGLRVGCLNTGRGIRAASGGSPTALVIEGGTATGSGTGGAVTATAGAGGTTGAGGAITLTCGASTTGTGGAFTVTTGTAATSGAGGALTLTAGNGAGAAGGAISITTGQGGGAGNGGALTIASATSTGTGTSGNVILRSNAGGSTSGASGTVAISTGNCNNGTPGTLSLTGGNGTTAGNTGGAITITTGNGGTASTGGPGGVLALLTGNGGGSSARNSGALTLTTGTPSATGASGSITLTTGSGGGTSGASGTITLVTGASTSGNTGGFSFTSGNAASGNSGSVQFIIGTASGTAGTFSVSGGAGDTTFTVDTIGGMSFVNADATGTTIFTMTDINTGAVGGPDLLLYRNSASAAANDVLGRIQFDGNSATPTRRVMARHQAVLITATNGAEDARQEWLNILAGTENLAMHLSAAGLLSLDADGGIGTAAYPVLFDDHDDIALIKSWWQPAEARLAARDRFCELGLMSKKPDRPGIRPGYMLSVQPVLSLLAGASLQIDSRLSKVTTRLEALEAENSMLRARLTAIEAGK